MMFGGGGGGAGGDGGRSFKYDFFKFEEKHGENT